MALKKKLTKADYDKLADAIKNEYIQDGDGFRLDIDGDEDTGALKRAKDREAQLRREAEKKATELQEQLDTLSNDDARKKGDVATLEKSWEATWSKKLQDQKAEDGAKVAKLSTFTTKLLVDNVAASIATKISNAPTLMLPHIRSRLQADFEGDEPKTRVLDKEGKPSALTIDELAAEFVANKDFSAIILASKASGSAGSASQRGSSGGSAPSGGNPQQPDLSKLSPTALAAQLKEAKSNQ